MSQAGRKSKLYRNSGTHASPTWLEIARVQDVSYPFSKGEVEVISRESDFKKFLAGLKEIGITFTYLYKKGTSDANFAALKDSAINDTPIEFFGADGNAGTAGTQGWRAGMQVFEFERAEELENAITYSVTLKLTEYESPSGTLVEPDFYVVP